MSDPYAPSPGESTQARIQALTANLPAYMQAMNSQVLPAAQAGLQAEQAISPQEQALQAQLYSQYAPQYAQAQGNADLSAIQGSGGQATLANEALQKQIDPEYYANRATMQSKLQDLLNNPISGSESTAIERANNKGQINSGTYDVNNSGNAISAAMNFGQAGRDRLGQALQLATSAAPSFQSGGQGGTANTFNQSTGRGANNSALGANNLTNQNLGSSAYGAGNSLSGQIASLQGEGMGIDANRRDSFDRLNQGIDAIHY